MANRFPVELHRLIATKYISRRLKYTTRCSFEKIPTYGLSGYSALNFRYVYYSFTYMQSGNRWVKSCIPIPDATQHSNLNFHKAYYNIYPNQIIVVSYEWRIDKDRSYECMEFSRDGHTLTK